MTPITGVVLEPDAGVVIAEELVAGALFPPLPPLPTLPPLPPLDPLPPLPPLPQGAL